MLEPHEEERLRQIQARLTELGEEPAAPEFSLGERAAQFGHGAATGTAGMFDLAANYLPSGQQMARAAVEDYTPEPELPPSNLRGEVGSAIDRLAGRSLEPTEEDKVGQFIHGAGEFAAPFPGSGYVKAAKIAGKSIPALVKGLGKVGGQELARGAGASAAMMTPQISEEGSLMSIPENIGKAVLGSRAGEKLLKPSTLKAAVMAPKRALENLPSKALALGTEPNKEVFELAEKHGVELPFNVGMGGIGGKAQSFMANNFLKTMFASKRYRESLRTADQSLVDAVKRNIDTLGTSELKPSEASGEYRRFLKQAEKEAKKESDKLYDTATSYLTPSDKLVPKHTLAAIEDMRDIVNRDIKSPATKKVVNILGELSEAWGVDYKKLGFKDQKAFKLALKNDPNMGTVILNAMGKKPIPIHLNSLNGVRKELGLITGYDKEARGVEALLDGLRDSITKDIEMSPNKEFVGAWQHANKNFRETIGNVFRQDIAQSIMTGEMPTEAFNLMSSAKNIKELDRIAGESPKGREVVDALKKAKVKDIFANTMNDEKLGIGSFINLFKKEKGQEILQSLLPKQSYDNMVDLTKIAKEYQEAGRELLNTSGTAWVTADINRINDVIKSAARTLFWTGVGSTASPLGGAIVGIATPNLLSRMVSNPKIVAKARAYALARQQGKEVYADTLMKQLMKMSEPDAKAALVAAQQSTKKEEKE